MKLTHYVGRDEGELYHVAEVPWEHDNVYGDPEYRDVKTALQARLIDFYAETEDPAIPGGARPPADGQTEAHRVWTSQWWEEDGSANPTPLAHLGGPGYPLERDGEDSNG